MQYKANQNQSLTKYNTSNDNKLNKLKIKYKFKVI